LKAQNAVSSSEKNIEIHLGGGFLYGGNIGCMGAIKSIERFGIALLPSLSIGIAEGGKDKTGKNYNWLGTCIGGLLEKGEVHKLFLGAHYFYQHTNSSALILNRKGVAGWSLILGYKLFTKSGFLFEIYIGDIYIQNETINADIYSHQSQVGIGIGYAFKGFNANRKINHLKQ
jgi:hypothetical protein